MHSKTIKWFTIGFGSVPVLGWVLSLPYNWWVLGMPFTGSGEWNNFPLWIATLPCSGIGKLLFNQNHGWPREHPYSLVILYTLICLVLYMLVGFAIGFIIKRCVFALKSRKK